MLIHGRSNPIPSAWAAHRLQKNSISEAFPQETSEPYSRCLSQGVWHGKEEPLGHMTLKASEACVQELHRTGGNGDPILKRRTQTFTCTEFQGKAKSPRESGSNLTAVLGGHPGKTGVNVACCEGRTLEAKLSGIFSISAFLWRWPFWENLAPPSVLRSPRPNNNPDGITAPHLSKQAT